MSMLRKRFEKLQNVFLSQTMTSITESKRFVFAVSGLLGAVFFICVFGVRVLNPTYIDWLIMPTIQDQLQHYVGWTAFRNADWFFPPGVHNGLTFPLTTSIVYSDSIPMFAIFFKAISPVLPATFQYFGWVGLLWYVLQGGFAGLIVKKISGCTPFSIICSLFFTMSSFMAYRMFNHNALAAHFLLLAAIYFIITKDESNRSVVRNCVIWGVLLGVTAAIHIYLLVMVFGLMCFYLLDDLFEYKKIVKAIIEFCVPMVVVLIVFFFTGVFASNAVNNDGGLGNHSANLNQIINPNAVYAEIGHTYSDFSTFLKPLPLIEAEYHFITPSKQSEGNTYIGLGMIILFFVAVFAFIDDIKEYKEKLSDKKNLRRFILIICSFFVYYIVALSPVITLNDEILFSYMPILPGKIIILWDIFRMTGRFAWVSVYILMIVILWGVVRKFKKPTLVIMAFILVLLQYQDISGYFNGKGGYFREQQVYQTSLKSEMWDVVVNDFDHLFYFSRFDKEHVHILVSQNGLTVNDSYIARKDIASLEAYKAEVWEILDNGRADPDTVYVFDGIPERLVLEEKIYIYIVDGMILGFASEVEGAENMDGVTRIT